MLSYFLVCFLSQGGPSAPSIPDCAGELTAVRRPLPGQPLRGAPAPLHPLPAGELSRPNRRSGFPAAL